MSMKPVKVMNVRCEMCQTELDIPISQTRIISTDQGAGFIQKPEYICEKCGSVCTITLPEPTG